jgi:hypothetical protein
MDYRSPTQGAILPVSLESVELIPPRLDDHTSARSRRRMLTNMWERLSARPNMRVEDKMRDVAIRHDNWNNATVIVGYLDSFAP